MATQHLLYERLHLPLQGPDGKRFLQQGDLREGTVVATPSGFDLTVQRSEGGGFVLKNHGVLMRLEFAGGEDGWVAASSLDEEGFRRVVRSRNRLV